ncbi:MAG: DUF790 family protein [Kofleriaceae bacterium]
MIAAGMIRRPARERLSLIGSDDFDWISEAIDVIERNTGRPWRMANELLDAMPVSRRRMNAVRNALARLMGAAKDLAPLAARTRELVLGAPVLDHHGRTSRLEAAGAELGLDASEVPALLFCDMRGERTIGLPHGRPIEVEVAAFANIALLQKALRYANRVTIHTWDDDGTLHRAAVTRGLLVKLSRPANDEVPSIAAPTRLDILGPLSLFHHTSVYGRLLGELVPLISGSQQWALAIEQRSVTLEVESPVLLPRATTDHRSLARPTKLARQLEAVARDRRESVSVIVGPPPLVADSVIACPDLALDVNGQRWYIELVGYWTRSFLEQKLAGYEAAGARHVLLCVDTSRMVSAELELAEMPAGHIVQYARTVHADAIYNQVVR